MSIVVLVVVVGGGDIERVVEAAVALDARPLHAAVAGEFGEKARACGGVEEGKVLLLVREGVGGNGAGADPCAVEGVVAGARDEGWDGVVAQPLREPCGDGGEVWRRQRRRTPTLALRTDARCRDEDRVVVVVEAERDFRRRRRRLTPRARLRRAGGAARGPIGATDTRISHASRETSSRRRPS